MDVRYFRLFVYFLINNDFENAFKCVYIPNDSYIDVNDFKDYILNHSNLSILPNDNGYEIKNSYVNSSADMNRACVITLENNNRNEIIIISKTPKITNTFFSLNMVFIIVIIFILNKPSKFLLNIKCKLTERYALIKMLIIIAKNINILLLIFFLLYWNSTIPPFL